MSGKFLFTTVLLGQYRSPDLPAVRFDPAFERNTKRSVWRYLLQALQFLDFVVKQFLMKRFSYKSDV